MKTILILNGPPSCGKDTLADALVEAFGWEKVEFKAALRKDVCEVFGVGLDDIRAHETRKEIPSDTFRHPVSGEKMSLRGAFIYVSEELVKPKHGSMVYGKRLLTALVQSEARTFVCSDGGFESELVPLLECGYRVRIMRMKRSGCSFKNDSRGYISDAFVLAASESGYDVFMVDFENDKAYAQFIQEGSTVALGLA
jgi:hypothetical protein